MQFVKTPLEDLWVVHHDVIKDNRGLFARTFCKKEFLKIHFTKEFVQFNHSFNLKRGTIRGMHYQIPPFTEVKLIRCLQGKVYDLAIDLREGSPTFLQSFGVELSAENMHSVLIPEGFAHGFQALEDNTTLIYHHTQYYNVDSDRGIRYDDERLGLNWPLPAINVSEKDKNYPLIEKGFRGLKI